MTSFSPTDTLQQRGERVYEITTKVGCGIRRFEKTGRAQLEALIRHGLNPWALGPGPVSAALREWAHLGPTGKA